MAYISSYKNQNWLIPLSIMDMIPKNHICFLVEDFVHSLDFSNFDMVYEGPGHPAYHPKILMKILIQGMLSKERSSRKLASACRENFVFMYLSEKVQPNFRTICRFRKDNANFIKETFKETIKLAFEHELVDLSLICSDGSKIKAYANKKKVVKKEALGILDKIIEKMIVEDITQDELDIELYGDKEENLTGMDRKDMKKIVQEYRKRKDKEKVLKTISKAKQEIKDNPKLKKVSLTDIDSRMMQNSKSFFELAYNAQFSVDSKSQIIIANDVCQDGHDAYQLEPQIKNVEENVGKLPEGTKVSLDCGYSSGENIKFLNDKKLDGYIPNRALAQEFDNKEQTLKHDEYEYDWDKDEIIYNGKRFKYRAFYLRKNTDKKILMYFSEDGIKEDVAEYFRERLRMKEKMKKPESRKVYSLRKVIVEPVIGNIKQNFGFREFILKGLNKVRIDLNLVCIAHNLKKVWSKANKTKLINAVS